MYKKIEPENRSTLSSGVALYHLAYWISPVPISEGTPKNVGDM